MLFQNKKRFFLRESNKFTLNVILQYLKRFSVQFKAFSFKFYMKYIIFSGTFVDLKTQEVLSVIWK